ncbi:MAG: metal-sensitive transcriptional regulator [Candidatus Marinamargulisbacteria bacterium]
MENDAITHRLSRIIGQLEALKKSINTADENDCLKTIQQLKASINGLKKFGEHYIKNHMKECVKKGSHSKEEMEAMLSEIISGAFSL